MTLLATMARNNVRSAAFSTAAAPPRYKRVRQFVANAVKGPLKLVGLAVAAAVAVEYKNSRELAEDAKGDKKRVLVLPFHRMRLVEARSRGNLMLESLLAGDDADDTIMEVEVSELVDAIHAAAQDPNVVALYGIFGHGFRFSSGGWAHAEEVRNALKVFRESHRIHREPNLTHEHVLTRNGNLTPKPTYAYADSFANPLDSGNQEYYLAAVFSHVHLQSQGELNMFGMGSSNTFLRDALKKYGVTAHVFKHGAYKNAPNGLTEMNYTREHKENVTNILQSVNQHVCDGIAQMRGLRNFDDPSMWNLVHNHGTFTAEDAHKIGLIDYMPSLDPLDQLVDSTQSENDKEEMKKKLGENTDMHNFHAKEKIELRDYLSLLEKRKQSQERNWKICRTLKQLAGKSTATRAVLKVMGFEDPYYNIDKKDYTDAKAASVNEKIALVRIQGSIDDKTARATAKTFRKIKKDKDVKCVVLRVDSPGGSVTASETILQECRDLPQPVICSMGNVAASGGYYIVTDCDRIFALPNTVTGSIGVFGVKLDFAEMAAQYGVTRHYISTGQHTATYDPFHPLTRPMRDNFTRQVDRYYHYFKSIVSQGRGLSMEAVEDLAEGRVWTGDQAKGIGLVDELGGLNRAVAYARRNYTSGEAVLEVWPKPKSLSETLLKSSEIVSSEVDKASLLQALWLALFQEDLKQTMSVDQGMLNLPTSGLVLAVDENHALQYCLRELMGTSAPQVAPLLPPDFWL